MMGLATGLGWPFFWGRVWAFLRFGNAGEGEGLTNTIGGCMVSTQIFMCYCSPRNLGRMIPILTSIFFEGVVETTN